MEFRILGPLEVRDNGGVVPLGGIKPRTLLTVLLLNANEPVSAERLVLALWGQEARSSAIKTVHVHVSRLRRALGDADIVTTTAAGYRLRVRPGELDAERFERLVDDGRRALADGQPEHAEAVLQEALALWRGPALADLAFEAFAAPEIARLEEQRLTALEARIEADLAVDRHAEVVGELQQLVTEHFGRERFVGQLMLALYRCGRQADALEVYREARRKLVDELGVEPGPELRRVQESILRQDGALESHAAVSGLPPELDTSTAPPLVGRHDELAWLRQRWEQARGGAGGMVILSGVSGSGKLRLAAELAVAAHDGGAAVLYATGSGPADAFLTTLRRIRQTTRPMLVIIRAADRAGAGEFAELEALSREFAELPVLVLTCSEDIDVLAGLRSDCVIVLEALDAASVAAIARQYARGTAADDVPAGWLLEASGGVPRVVHQVASQWAQREAARHVGVVAGRAASERDELRSIQAELTGGVEDLQEVRERIAPRRWDAPVVCPFKGLASFDVADAQYFFGREKLVAELVTQLVGAQLLGIVGPSGSGKSSVMRAGLLPALASGVLPGSERWHQVLIRPGEHPLRDLTDALAELEDSDRAVIAVDQFEETFTTCEDEAERAAFIAELVRATREGDGRCVVVIALRADFYGRCAGYPELAGLLASNHVLVRSMQRDELGRAVELPARRVGLRVDPELADALVADVKDEPGALPLLSTALLELWQHRDGRRLRYTVYEQSGGVRGAVARLAEDAFGRMDGDQQVVARGVLMRLAGESPAGGVERRRVALAELETDSNEDVARVVALLTDRRLLTVSSGAIELAHEAVLREWPRLRDWIDADREGLRIHRNLNAAAREWEQLGRDDGALYRGARLAEAAEWNEAKQPRLNEIEHAFVRASNARHQEERAARRRRLRLSFAGMTIALAAITAVAIAAIYQGNEAERQREISVSRELAVRATSLLDADPGLSVGLALEALKQRDTTQAENALRQATLVARGTAVWRGHDGWLYAARPSRDGQYVATAGQNGTVRIWNVHRGRVVSTIRQHQRNVYYTSFSPDSSLVASAGADGVVAISDTDGRHRHELRHFRDALSSVDFSANGRRLVVATFGDGRIRLVPVDGHGKVIVLSAHKGAVYEARFNRDATKVVSAGADHTARIWDVASRTSKSLPHPSEVFSASFSPDSRRVATAGDDGKIRIWSVSSGALLKSMSAEQPLFSVRYSEDGQRLLTAGEDGVLRLWDVRSGLELDELKGHQGRALRAEFVPHSDLVVSAGEDNTLRSWAPLRTTVMHGDVNGVSFSRDERYVVGGSSSGAVHVWDLKTGAHHKLSGHKQWSVARFWPSGARIISSSQDGSVLVWSLHRGRWRSYHVPAGTWPKWAAALDRAGRHMAICGAQPRLVVQRPHGGDRIVLRGHDHRVLDVTFSPDGRHVLSASEDGTARIWNAANGKPEHVFSGHKEAVNSASYSTDGQRVVTAGSDGTVRVWRVRDGRSLIMRGHAGPVLSARFNRAGDRVVSAGQDGTVRVWNAAGGETLEVLQKHQGPASGADFSPDGREVISAGSDGLVLITPCDLCGRLSALLRRARATADRELSPAERQRFLSGNG